MRSGAAEQTGGGGAPGPPSFTTLSTIAVQAGRSHMSVSVLQSGALIHLQLVQVHPSLSEIGWDQEENQTLVQDHQQLLQKLQKHEGQVLSVVSSQRDGGMKKEEGLSVAMAASVEEGWSLLLRLLRMRQEVLMMASDFFSRASEFTVSLDQYEEQIRPGSCRLTGAAYACMRRELLQKSLQVLTSSSVLLEHLRQLQRTEALQRSGGVLQAQTSPSSGGAELRLEQLLEALQDRRRSTDQMFRLQLQGDMETGPKVSMVTATSADNPGLEADLGNLHPVCGAAETNLQFGFRLTLETKSGSEETRTLHPGSGLLQGGGLQPETRPEEPSWSGSRSDLEAESPDPGDLWSELQRDLMIESSSDLQSDSQDTRTQQSGSRSPEDPDLDSEPRDPPSVSRPTESGDLLTNSKLEESRGASANQPGSKLDQPGWRSGTLDQEPASGGCESTCGSEETTNLPAGPSRLPTRAHQGFRQVSGSVQTGKGDSGCRLTGSRIPLLPLLTSRLDLKSVFTPEETTGPRPGSRSHHGPGSEPHVQEASMWDSGSGPGATSDVRPDVHLRSPSDQLRSTLDPEPEPNRDLETVPPAPETLGPQSGLRPGHRNVVPECDLDLEPGSDRDHQPREDPRHTCKDILHSRVPIIQQSGPGPGPGPEVVSSSQPEGDPPANQRRELLSSWQHLIDETWTWVQLGYSRISNGPETGWQISEAEDALNTHVELQARAEAADQSLEEVLAPSRTRSGAPLKALMERLRSRGGPAPSAGPAASLSPELARRAALLWSELQTLKMEISSNLLLLRPYVRFLRMVHQVEEDMEELRTALTRKENQEEHQEEDQEENQEEEAERGNDTSGRSRRRKFNVSWEEAQQKFLAVQELGNNFISSVATVSAAQVHLQMFVVAAQQQLERLAAIKQEVQELRCRQVLVLQQQAFRRHQEQLQKTLQNLGSVSELLDSCTLMDLGSDLQTSRLLQSFSQARPHFTQLDAEVENMKKSWESVRGEQHQLELQDIKEMLQLQDSVKTKIRQAEQILDLSRRFHHTGRQLEALLHTVPAPGPETQEQVQGLLETTSGLRMEIYRAVSCSRWTRFRLEQLEARLSSLDSLCVSWRTGASRREKNLQRDVLTAGLSQDLAQLRDSFTDLQKHLSNLQLSFLERSEGSGRASATRNQLQQVELYQEKLQELRKCLQVWAGRLGSEVKGGALTEAEAAGAQLSRQMEELEQSLSHHQKTLEMSRKLQQAAEEFQFWCEEAGAAIARVHQLSLQPGSAAVVAALHQQFQMFEWPTVAGQERMRRAEPIATSPHGEGEGRCYVAKTVKHSEIVGSIKELNVRLMEVETNLKLQHLKQQQKSEDEVMEETKMDTEQKDEETEETKEKNLMEKKRTRTKKEVDGRDPEELVSEEERGILSFQLELKETGLSPEVSQHPGTAPLRTEVLTSSRSSSRSRSSRSSSRRSRNSRRSSSSRSSRSSSRSSEEELQSLNTCNNLSCSLLEAQRQIHTVPAHLSVAMAPQATPPPADASAGGWSEVEGASEDSLSSEEGASPDDVSLPLLAETPERVVQWEVEEGVQQGRGPPRPSPSLQQAERAEIRAPTTSARMDPGSSPGHRGGPASQHPAHVPGSSVTLGDEHTPQPVCSTHQCFTSSSTQQCLHEPGMAPSSPAGPAAPAWPLQAGLHEPRPPPPPLLTQADVCQPRSICEEIRLTPQIRGAPPPAPPAPPQGKPLLQRKGPRSAPRGLSRPPSGAAVVEGSPVTLEVEVSGHPEPTLTGCRDPPRVGGALPGVPQTSEGGEGWLLLGVLRVAAEDWRAVLGTLCVLLWLLQLTVL